MNTAELARRLDNLIRFGVIEETDFTTDPVQPRVRVRTGEILTTWIPIATNRANTDAEHDPVQKGEHVILAAPSGELTQAVVIGKLFSNDFPSPDTSPTNHRRVYRDGAVIEYDSKTHHLNATLPDGGTTNLFSTGGITITGDITHKGDYTQTGNYKQTGDYIQLGNQATVGTISATGNISSAALIMGAGFAGPGGNTPVMAHVDINTTKDVTAGGISLRGHVHPTPGGMSGPPQGANAEQDNGEDDAEADD